MMDPFSGATEEGDIVAEARTLAAAGNLPGALEMLEAGLRAAPDLAGRAPAPAGQAYVDLVVEATATLPQVERHLRPMRAALTGLVDRNPGALRAGWTWMDRALRRDRHFTMPVRAHLWRMVLESGTPAPGEVREIVAHAHNAREMGTLAAALPHLCRLAEAGGELRDWVLAGDLALLLDETETAEALFLAAIDIDRTEPRALMGLMGVALDAGDLPRAVELAGRAAARLREDGDEEAGEIVDRASGLWARRAAMPPPETLEVAIFCHVTSKLRRNAHLAAPGVGLVETAVRSLREAARPGPAHTITVFYDHRDTPLNRAYLETLLRYCNDEGLGLVVNTGNGLRKQWLHAFSRSKADLMMVVEQDHEFVAPCPSLEEMRAALAARPDIGHLRLNRRANVRAGFDVMLQQTARDRETGLVRTARFSNTPHVIRRDFYDEVVLPIIEGRTRHDGRNAGAGGVEENVNNVMRRLEPILGLGALLRLFGLAIWGNPGEAARCNHLGV